MTPKEKAFSLYFKYIRDVIADNKKAKQCAIIAVNEIILANPHSNPFNTEVYSTMSYWQQVKKEIEKI
jgi:hypothetical protein